jgi:hypothetical protein
MNRLITVNSYTMLASTIIIATAIKVIVLMRARSSSVSPDTDLLMQPAVSSRIGASQESLPTVSHGGVFSLLLIDQFAMSRTKAGVNPPAAIPQITGPDA